MMRVGVLSEISGAGCYWPQFTEPLRRVESQLTARGIELVRRDPDLILVDSAAADHCDAACPLLIFDMTDGGMLWWYGAPHEDRMRAWLKSPRVAGVLKVAKYVNVEMYNRPCTEGAYHLQQIYESLSNRWPPSGYEPRLTLKEHDWAKIEVAYGFWAFNLCESLAAIPVDLNAERTIDVFFAGSLAYASPSVTHHRCRAVEQLERLRNLRAQIMRGRDLDLPAYQALLQNARICVSPWGWGETTIRDYEAMYAGCVLIKPRTDFVELWPAIDEGHYVPCAVDFSDLEEKVGQVLSHWDDYAAVRHANRARLLAVRNPDCLADLLARIFRHCVERIE
jgi:hypothetical protein